MLLFSGIGRSIFKFHCFRIVVKRRRSRVTILDMEKAYFRYVDGEKEFHVTFHYKSPELALDRQINFCRDINEDCNTFLTRVNNNVSKIILRKLRRKSRQTMDTHIGTSEDDQTLDLKCALLHKNVAVDGNLKFKDFFKMSGPFVLKIHEMTWEIMINCPFIENLHLPKGIMVGFPVYPSKITAYFADIDNCSWIWGRCQGIGGPWFNCGIGYPYVPVADDIGFFLRLVCVPKNTDGVAGPAAVAISPGIIESRPGDLPYEQRHLLTVKKFGNEGIRVLTYNILADLYVDSSYARTVLFPYCPPNALDIAYRKQLFFEEITGYHADIVCLQEVDNKLYNGMFEPLLSKKGYGCEFSQKGGLVCEGEAIFYDNSKFQKEGFERILLTEALKSEPLFATIWQVIRLNTNFLNRLRQRNTILQITLLESLVKADHMVMVANTHLYFHPDADHVRLFQAVIIMKLIEDRYQKYAQDYPSKKLSLILCGDFNSTPECGVHKLITKGAVDGNEVDWKSNPDEALSNIVYSHQFKIANAYEGSEKHFYTTYKPDFKGFIDYIFYQTDFLKLKRYLPLPPEEELEILVGLPNPLYPSDHIALIAEFEWL